MRAIVPKAANFAMRHLNVTAPLPWRHEKSVYMGICLAPAVKDLPALGSDQSCFDEFFWWARNNRELGTVIFSKGVRH